MRHSHLLHIWRTPWTGKFPLRCAPALIYREYADLQHRPTQFQRCQCSDGNANLATHHKPNFSLQLHRALSLAVSSSYRREKKISLKSRGGGRKVFDFLESECLSQTALEFSPARRFRTVAAKENLEQPIATIQEPKMNSATKKQTRFIIVETGGSVPPGVALIKLNRPQAMNALCLKLCEELVEVLEKIDAAEDLKCAVLTGEGEKAFAAGADIKELASVPSSQELQQKFLGTWQRLDNFRKPLIAAVNGVALGGGCELALLCDILFASNTATFGLPEVLIGVIPGMGGTQRLPRAVGKSRAMEMILTGKKISAQEALEAGLVSRVLPSEKLVQEALSVAAEIARLSLPSILAAKECVNRSFALPLKDGLDYERQCFVRIFATDDRTEGMQAFVQKRLPKWKHR